MNSSLIDQLTAYFSTNGTLADAVNFVNMVASGAWGDIAHLAKILGL
jgi:hypothetical protein